MKNDLVFVYGTLKYGHGNWRWALFDQTYLGRDVTEDTYILGDVGFPYCFPKSTFNVEMTETVSHLFKPVVGDVFSVNEEAMERLDRLEGYPSHYNRIRINTRGGHECWMYVQEDASAIYSCYQCDETQEGEWEWQRAN